MSSDNLQFPCPACGQSRGNLESACQHCQWHPDQPVENQPSLYGPATDSRWHRIRATWILMTIFSLSIPMSLVVIVLGSRLFIPLPVIVLSSIPGILAAAFTARWLDDTVLIRNLGRLTAALPILWIMGMHIFFYVMIFGSPHGRGMAIAMYFVMLKWFLIYLAGVVMVALASAVAITGSRPSPRSGPMKEAIR